MKHSDHFDMKLFSSKILIGKKKSMCIFLGFCQILRNFEGRLLHEAHMRTKILKIWRNPKRKHYFVSKNKDIMLGFLFHRRFQQKRVSKMENLNNILKRVLPKNSTDGISVLFSDWKQIENKILINEIIISSFLLKFILKPVLKMLCHNISTY
jgi:hypothetical protein